MLLAALLGAGCARQEAPGPTMGPAVAELTAPDPAGTIASRQAAASSRLGDLEISNAWARATAPGAAVGAAYLRIVNTGASEDTLLAMTTDAAQTAELHQSSTENGVARMRPAGPRDIPGGQSLAVEPGGLHVMLNGLRAPLVAGSTLSLTLVFRRAGSIIVPVTVRPMTDDRADATHDHAGD